MIDLYALTSPNVQKIYIMLEECGLPYKEHFVDVWKGEQYKPEFAKINPNNKIPAIVDHDGPGGKPYTVIETRLGKVPYLGGQEYSIADMATFPWTRNHDAQGVKWEDNPNLARWFNAINERPAVKAAIAKITAIKSNRETASDDDKDRFFNRGRYARA